MNSPARERLGFSDGWKIAQEIGLRGAMCGPLYLLYFGIPALIVFLVFGEAVHRSWLWALGIAFSLLVEFTWITLGPMFAAVENSRNAINWFSDDATGGGPLIFREISQDDLSRWIPVSIRVHLQNKYRFELLNTTLGRRLAHLSSDFVPLRVFVVQSRVLASIRSYGSLKSTSFIFLVEDPSSMELMDRFKFYHELAHTTYAGCITFARRYGKALSFLFSTIVISVMTPFSLWLAAILVFLAFRSWWAWTIAPIDCEMYADRAALGALGDSRLAGAIVQVFKAVWREDPFRLYREYGQRAMMERDFRFWNMEAAVHDLERADQSGAALVGTPGRDHVPFVIATYLAAGWAGWHSADTVGLGLVLMAAVLTGLFLGARPLFIKLFASERALELAVESRMDGMPEGRATNCMQ